MKVRGKFTVTEVINRSATSTYVVVKLQPVYSNTPEDNSYSAATPSGSIEMTITNPSAVETLAILGKKFYVEEFDMCNPSKKLKSL
jgi:hypothetical protein